MFEKEAEEYVNTHVAPPFSISEQDLYDCFQRASTFGYNKANEWHYVKDSDLPTKTTLVLIKACGCFILGWLDDNDVWHNDSDNGARIPKENIIAWKEIVFSKESE